MIWQCTKKHPQSENAAFHPRPHKGGARESMTAQYDKGVASVVDVSLHSLLSRGWYANSRVNFTIFKDRCGVEGFACKYVRAFQDFPSWQCTII
jgi:hypothetical protein